MTLYLELQAGGVVRPTPAPPQPMQLTRDPGHRRHHLAQLWFSLLHLRIQQLQRLPGLAQRLHLTVQPVDDSRILLVLQPCHQRLDELRRSSTRRSSRR